MQGDSSCSSERATVRGEILLLLLFFSSKTNDELCGFEGKKIRVFKGGTVNLCGSVQFSEESGEFEREVPRESPDSMHHFPPLALTNFPVSLCEIVGMIRISRSMWQNELAILLSR
ncbi:hypothetical protein COLO4_35623 [Corchorus olitorius]|uniref:Uncharacterized protein n=1 Tax=Corchorus olitorius TaxID=93759 RepID=A0A1R3GEK7_9ROSI|nr:hypothetical protein COLO4_35623 [Corchorus olitorius]